MTTYIPELGPLFSSIVESPVANTSHTLSEPVLGYAQPSLILTPNHRLSRFLHSQYGMYQSSQGLNAWSSFSCLSLNNWIQVLWDETSVLSLDSLHSCLLLDKSHEISLWRDIVVSTGDDIDIFSPSAAAVECRRAWHTLVQWGFVCLSEDWNENWHDELNIPKEFIAWMKAFHLSCRKKSLIDSSSRVNVLLNAAGQHSHLFPQQIVLFAFDDMTPQFSRLCKMAEQHGTRVQTFSIDRNAQCLFKTELADVEAEITAAARRALAVVESDPEARVGIVVPQLASLRAKVEHIFTDVFEPQYIMPFSQRHASGFNISAAIPLSQTPPIAAALLALKLNFSELDIEELSKILMSPFIGTFDDLHIRGLFDNYLRENFRKVRIHFLRQAVGNFGYSVPPEPNSPVGDDDTGSTVQNPMPLADIYQRLHALHQSVQGLPKKQRPSDWAMLFNEQLTLLGWPGTRSLDTLEYQQIEVWQESLTKLNTFDYIYNETTLAQTLSLLERVAVDTPFQAQTYDSAVQVLGVFEAAGMAFDYLWVMNCDNESWPPAISPSSILPLALQKREGMPKSSVERELALARQLTERFKSSAHEVVFSYCVADGDKQLQASPLIDALPLTDHGSFTYAEDKDYLSHIFDSGGLQTCVDDRASPIVDCENMRGGTQILKDQAACPFRSFASHRLGARPLEKPSIGLSAAERGILIHSTLELIWKMLKNQQGLLELDKSAVSAIVNKCIYQSFKQLEHQARQTKTLGERLKSIESERIHRFMVKWLELEKQRAPFSVIFNETQKTLYLGRLPIHIRYDRIDQLSDHSLFVVDYKTGTLAIRSWAGERPDEPQVPLYCLANRDEVSGAAFGQINVEQVAYKGISRDSDVAPGVSMADTLTRLDLPASWTEIVAYWDQVLTSLADEYVGGIAEVKPKHGELTCRYCALKSLCRVKQVTRVNDNQVADVSDASYAEP